MINTKKMQGRIKEKGFTNITLAPLIGCSAYTLGQKILNKAPITIDETEKFCKHLDITVPEFPEFFLQ